MFLTADDFAAMFGGAPVYMPEKVWSYEVLQGKERDDVIIDLLKRIREKGYSSVTGDNDRWLKGWGENFEALKTKGIEGLEPAYIRKSNVYRLNGEFIRTASDTFERDWYEVYRLYLFQTYLTGYSNIFEFGCGSGFNVNLLSNLYLNTHITGLDWVEPSVNIVNWLKTEKGMNVDGRLFDFFNPDYSLEIPEGSAVLTIGAMEQTAYAWRKFLDFLLVKKPAIVVHSEPIVEFYNQTNLVDWLAAHIHGDRNFWSGYLNALYELRDEGKIEIIKQHRTGFGSLLLEGYSQLIWRPL